MEKNNWSEWSRHVLSELERLFENNEHLRKGLEEFKVEIARDLVQKTELETLRRDIRALETKQAADLAQIRIEHRQIDKELRDIIAKIERDHGLEIASLKVKAGLWGALAGAIPALAALIFFVINLMIK
jgi:hypothetical protein